MCICISVYYLRDRGRAEGLIVKFDENIIERLTGVGTQETACSSDSRLRRKVSGTTDIVFWERRDRRRCVWQHGSGYVYLQSLWWYLWIGATRQRLYAYNIFYVYRYIYVCLYIFILPARPRPRQGVHRQIRRKRRRTFHQAAAAPVPPRP